MRKSHPPYRWCPSARAVYRKLPAEVMCEATRHRDQRTALTQSVLCVPPLARQTWFRFPIRRVLHGSRDARHPVSASSRSICRASSRLQHSSCSSRIAASVGPALRASILTCCCEVRREILLARCCEPTVDLFGTRLRFFNCPHARPLREAPELASDRIVVQEVHP